MPAKLRRTGHRKPPQASARKRPARRTPKRTPASGGMWRRIEIRNYRSIEHAAIELPPFAVVVGPNGSGKSAFADVLVFLRDIGLDAFVALERRGGISSVRRWRPGRPTEISIDLRAARTKSGLDSDYVRHSLRIESGRGQFRFAEERIEIVAKGVATDWITRTGDVLKRRDGTRLPAIQSTASAMVLAGQLRGFSKTWPLRNVRCYRLSPDAMHSPQPSSEQVRLDERGANLAVAVREVRRTGRMTDLLRAMAKIVPGLRDVSVRPVGQFLTLEFERELEQGRTAVFHTTEMSEGALRALGIIVATLQMEPDELLIIEEPEVSIHVGAASLLFDVLKEASEAGAVLITTHSADLLDAARDEEILVCEYAKGVTAIGPLAAEQRRIVREGLFSVSELMRSEPLRIEAPQRAGRARQ